MTELTWNMTRSPKSIRVSYHIANRGTKTLYVNDGLVVLANPNVANVYRRFSANYTVEAQSADTVSITVGMPSGDVPAAAPVPAFYVAVAPNASFDGARDVDVPFRRYDAMGREKPLGDKFTKAVFAIQTFEGEPPTWRELPAEHGTIRIPENPAIRVVSGAAQPIPK